MSRYQKLELTWIGKDEELNLEPRILIEDKSKAYGERDTENMLIKGDNLLALKALEADFTAKVKCIYIDPPYNTGNAFEHYDDGLEHSLWLSLMRDRLKLLWSLLRLDNGILLISVNDDECHYLKVLCDELFGRNCFISCLIWNYEGNTDNQAKIINYHEYILVYSKSGEIDDPDVIDPNISEKSKIFNSEIRNTIVKNGPKNPPVMVKIPKGFPASFEKGLIKKDSVNYPQYSDDIVVENFKTQNSVRAISGWSSRKILETFIDNEFTSTLDSKGQNTIFEITSTGAIEAVKQRQQKKGHFVSVLRGFGTTNQMRIFLEKMGLKFTYPKPVNLISYLIEAFSGPNDLILDSFAGSGTTAHAVLKLNLEKKSDRKFILVELYENNIKVITERLKHLIKGNSNLSIASHNGGFKYYHLAPSLLQQDEKENWLINPVYDENMVAEAMAKHQGFTYKPDLESFWKQGFSTENDYIYTTSKLINLGLLKEIHESMKDKETLLICCKAFEAKCEKAFHKITIKKIPASVLKKCEFGKEDYSLKITETNSEEEPSLT